MSNTLSAIGIKRIPIKQRTQAWFDWRQGLDLPDGKPRITATTATVIAGDSVTGQTPYQLWMEMTGRRVKPEANDFLKKLWKHGEVTEPKARQAYIDYTGNIVEESCVEHPLHRWCASSLDGLTRAGDIHVEIKCPISQRIHNMAKNQDVPSYYYLQVQWQLMCLPDNVEAHYWSYYEEDEDGVTGALVVVKRDEQVIHRLFNEALNFRTCVLEDRPPASDDWLVAAKLFREAKLEEEEAAARLSTAQKRLIDLMPLDKKTFDGGGVMVTCYPVKGKVDYAKLIQDLNKPQDEIKIAVEAARAPGEVDYRKALELMGFNEAEIDELFTKHRVEGELRYRFTEVKGYLPEQAAEASQAAEQKAAETTALSGDGQQDWTW
jgi:putative phage-type endonuclease